MNNTLEININKESGKRLITEATKVVLPENFTEQLTDNWKIMEAKEYGAGCMIAEEDFEALGGKHKLHAVLDAVDSDEELYSLRGFKIDFDPTVPAKAFPEYRTESKECIRFTPMQLLSFKLEHEQAVGEQIEEPVVKEKVPEPFDWDDLVPIDEDDDDFFGFCMYGPDEVRSFDEANTYVNNFYFNLQDHILRRMKNAGIFLLRLTDRWQTGLIPSDDGLQVFTRANSKARPFNKLSCDRRIKIYLSVMSRLDEMKK